MVKFFLKHLNPEFISGIPYKTLLAKTLRAEIDRIRKREFLLRDIRTRRRGEKVLETRLAEAFTVIIPEMLVV